MFKRLSRQFKLTHGAIVLMVVIMLCVLAYHREYAVTQLKHYHSHTQTIESQAQRQQDAFETWQSDSANAAQAEQAQAYQEYLTRHVSKQVTARRQSGSILSNHSVYVPPLHQLLHNSHAVKHASCNLPAFTVPPRQLWRQMVPTLVLINQLTAQGILPDDLHVTSGYRDKRTNECVGGSNASKHMKNAALDFTLTNTLAELHRQTERRLCEFWQQHGRTQRMGLGTYGAGRYHIDTHGFRTWGQDFKRGTSRCLIAAE